MRHGKKHNHLGRKAEHRQALLMNLSNALIEHKRIQTTLAKAKALRVHLEPLVTRSKEDNTHNRRVAFSYLQSKEAIKELFDVIGPRIGDRPGGYLRILKIGFRRSDASEMAMIEFVDFNDVYTANAEGNSGATSTKKRSRRGSGKAKTTAPAAAPVVVDETPAIEDAILDDSDSAEETKTEE
jgi:large subunit ribosomal protein L17